MAKQSQKLELTWIGKGNEPQLEPRILIEDPSKSFGDPKSENMLIHGDNLLALKALEQNFTNKIKCIYIDPPYNTGNAFEHYDDGIEHSLWLSLIEKRIKILKTLLSEDGAIFVQIDDNEAPYLKVIMDEIFGRSNYEATFYIKVRHEDRILREDIKYQLVIEQVLCYRKSEKYNSRRRVKIKDSSADYEYDIETIGAPSKVIKVGGYNVEIYSRINWKLTNEGHGNGTLKQYQIRGSLITQSGSASEYYEKHLRQRKTQDGLGTLYKVIGMGQRGDGLGYRYIMQPDKESSRNGFYFQGKPIAAKKNTGLPFPNFYDFVDQFNKVAYEGGVEFRNGKKPEAYVGFFIELSNSKEGDYVLDSFLGSGTSVAVAHKMNRKWIGVELGEHAVTHCLPRLKQVISGADKGGITGAANWKGGGGFKFYTLAPSLIQIDKYGSEIINPAYNANMLAAAMAKQEGFRYEPHESTYWKQGMSSEKDFIFTTTQFITVEMLDSLSEEMQPTESVLVCCKSFAKGCANKHPNITIKKIPQMLLGRCEFGKDDYSLNIVNLPPNEVNEDSVNYDSDEQSDDVQIKGNSKKKKEDESQTSLF